MGNKISSLIPGRTKQQSHSISFIYGGLIESEVFIQSLKGHKDYIKDVGLTLHNAGKPLINVKREEGSTIITFQQSKPFRTKLEDKLERAVMEILGLNGTNGTLTKLMISTKQT